jgi:DNA modification methylase
MSTLKRLATGSHQFAMVSGEMSDAEFLGFTEAWIKVVLHYLADGGVFGTFVDWRGSPTVHAAATALGLTPLSFIVWAKANGGHGQPLPLPIKRPDLLGGLAPRLRCPARAHGPPYGQADGYGTSRICLGVELDTFYVDVIVRRFEMITGQTTTLAGTGETFTALRQYRVLDTKLVEGPEGEDQISD